MLVDAFCREITSKKAGREIVVPLDGPCPRIELSYTYLMAWFTMYYPSLIKPGEEPPEGAQFSLLCHFENSHWSQNYMVRIRKMVHCHDNYSLFQCFSHIPGTEYDEEFNYEGINHSSLGQGTFKWLINTMKSSRMKVSIIHLLVCI